MSILLVELVPQGIIFGADRKISSEEIKIKYEDRSEDRPFIEQHHYHFYESPRPKVLRWPKHKALIGYVAHDATLGGRPTDEWLYDFIGDHLQFDSFESLAESLRQSVEHQRIKDEDGKDPVPIIFHLAGFEEREGIQVPAVWVIRNDHSRPPQSQYLSDIRKEFEKVDCLWVESHDWYVPPQNLRNHLSDLAAEFKPFWFHQGVDLATFNLLEAFLKVSLRELYRSGLLDRSGPQNLEDWERQVQMSILMYGAYSQAYQKPYEQNVGGGVDTISIP
jgi:hypothetical protein